MPLRVSLSGRAAVAVVGAVLLAVAARPPQAVRAAQGDGAGARIWSGVYAPDQAERGKTGFTGLCRRCHNDDLNGSERAPALRGESFMSNWEAQGLDRLFSKIRDTMPQDKPASIPDEEYLDILIYVLSHTFPAGKDALTMEDLDAIQIVRKPGEAPTELRNFSLVEVVGCLTQGEGNLWLLTGTSNPVLTRDQPATAEELKRAAGQPAGPHTFQLVSVTPFKPESLKGQKIEAKGLMFRAPNRDRLNVSSIQPVASSCSN